MRKHEGGCGGKATDVAANLARVQEATSKQSQLLRTSSAAAPTHFHQEIRGPQLIRGGVDYELTAYRVGAAWEWNEQRQNNPGRGGVACISVSLQRL